MNTSFRMALQGYIPAAAAATGNAIVFGNTAYEPFATSTPVTTGWPLNLTDASSTTGTFPGWSFYAAGYNRFRVRSSRLRVTAVSGVTGDSFNVWMFPVTLDAAGTSVTYMQSVGQPGCQSAMVTAGMRPVSLTSSVAPWDVLGKSLQQYMDDPNTAGLTASGVVNTEGSTAWILSYATMDGGVTVGQLYFTFEIEYNVDFFDAKEILV